MADSTDLKLRIVPELDESAKRKVQDELDKFKSTVPVIPSGGGTSGSGGTGSTQAQTKAIKDQNIEYNAQGQIIGRLTQEHKERVKQIQTERKAQDLLLRSTRTQAEDAIQALQQKASIGQITMDQMNQGIAEQTQIIQTAEATARDEFTKTTIALGGLANQYESLQAEIVNAQTGVFHSTARLNNGFNTMSGSMQKVTSQTKNANLAFMNFGRIIQDAPFGLIGIANNIDPMVVTFANLSKEIDVTTGKMRGFGGAMSQLGKQLLGPAGLIFILGSLIPSALLMLQSRQREQRKESEQSTQETERLGASFLSLSAQIELANKGILDQSSVLRRYNKELGDTVGQASSLVEAEKMIVLNADDYIKATFAKEASLMMLNKASFLYMQLQTDTVEVNRTVAESIRFYTLEILHLSTFTQALIEKTRELNKEQEKDAFRLRAQEKMNEYMENYKNLLEESMKVLDDMFETETKRAGFVDQTLISQAQLRIGAENSLYIAQQENLTWEQRQRAFDDGIAKSKQIVGLQQQSVAEQMKVATEEQEKINLQVKQIELANELNLLDRQSLEFARQRADAEFDVWVARQQTLLDLRDELLQFESESASSLLGDLDIDDSVAQARFASATEWIDRQAQYEIDKALYVGDRIKALSLEKDLFIAQQRSMYIDQEYDAETANAMAIADANKEFAIDEMQVRKEVNAELFSAIGEFSSQALGAIFGESKGVAIAQVVIDTAMGIQKIWAQSGINPVVGALASAALAAKGMTAISKIRNTKKDGASGTGTGGGTAVVRESYYDGFDAIRGVKSPPRGMEGDVMDEERRREAETLRERIRKAIGNKKIWDGMKEGVDAQINQQLLTSSKMLDIGNRQMAMSQSFMGIANTTAEMLGDRSLEMTQPISVQANVDRRGLAIAVREGEMEIRTSEFTYI
jgi:hypothetical protein